MTATPAAVTALRRAVEEFATDAGVSDPPLSDVKLAVSEAIGNAVVHSYRADDAPGQVEVRARHADGELRLVVADHGQGYAPRTDSPGLGLGVAIMSALADHIEIRNVSPRGTEVHICWTLTS